MSALEKFLYFSEAQYLEFEKTTSIRHEYVNGSIHAMAGANEQHNLSKAGGVLCQRCTKPVTDRIFGRRGNARY
jgi:hypothetical protein